MAKITTLRKNMPFIIAQYIVGVQPMSNPFSKQEWPYQEEVNFNNSREIREWCSTNLNKEEYASNAQFFAFKTESAYSWFLLRWGDECRRETRRIFCIQNRISK